MADEQNHKTKKSCGTCRFWIGWEGARMCAYPLPKLPIWAAAGASDFGNDVRDYDGEDCEVWAMEMVEPADG